MAVNIYENDASMDTPLLVRAREMAGNRCVFSVEDAVSIIEELAEYEKEIRGLRQEIFEATYADILVGLIRPLKEHLE